MFGLWRKPAGDPSDLRPGDDHYRAYVGPPRNYDLIGAMVFNLLTCVGLRQHHRLLDIGCGSLRVGRLLIPYLDPGNYIGVEPNKRMLWEGVKHETGKDLIRIKKPVFSYGTSLKAFAKPLGLDYVVAQSIFSHCSKEIIDGWLGEASMHLKDTGVLLANFGHGQADYVGSKWVYPGCVRFKSETMEGLAEKHGLRFEMLDWYHPVLTWALFSKPGYDRSFVDGGEISWNRMGKALTAKR